MSGGNQIATAVASAGTQKWGAATAGLAASLDLSSGKIEFAIAINSLPLVATGNGAASVYVSAFSAGFSEVIGAHIISEIGAYSLFLIADGSTVSSTPLGTSLPSIVRILANADAGTFGVFLPDGSQVGGTQSFTPQPTIPLLALETDSISGPSIGITLSAGFVTDAGALAPSPVAGYSDPCGNPVGVI